MVFSLLSALIFRRDHARARSIAEVLAKFFPLCSRNKTLFIASRRRRHIEWLPGFHYRHGGQIDSPVRIKHCTKRMDRLIGNRLLHGERKLYYQAMSHWLLCGISQPLILVDWSDLVDIERIGLLQGPNTYGAILRYDFRGTK